MSASSQPPDDVRTQDNRIDSTCNEVRESINPMSISSENNDVITSDANASHQNTLRGYHTESEGGSTKYITSHAGSLYPQGHRQGNGDISATINSKGEATANAEASHLNGLSSRSSSSNSIDAPLSAQSVTTSSFPSAPFNKELPTSQHIGNSVSSIPQSANTSRDPAGMSTTSHNHIVANGSSLAVAQQAPCNTSTSQQILTNGSGTSYADLGFFTSCPKRLEFAVHSVRLESFQGWPKEHHMKPTILASAGFFYTGYSDCARCFYCGVGFRNWVVDDDVWVEHARWSPRCGFLCHAVGQAFVDTVQVLSRSHETIIFRNVITEMKRQGLDIVIPKDTEGDAAEILRDPAVQVVLEMGFEIDEAVKVAIKLRESGQSWTSDLLYEELCKLRASQSPGKALKSALLSSISNGVGGNASDVMKQVKDKLKDLKEENCNLRQEMHCKVCLLREVSMIYIPCGHFATCRDCAYALRSCPICRRTIQGLVRGHLQ